MNRLPLAAALCCAVLITLTCGLLSQCGEKKPIQGQQATDHTAAILAFGPRPPASEALGKTRDYISSTLAASGWVCQERTFNTFTPKGQVTFTNVVARYAPDGDKDEVWTRPATGILAAHIDSKLYTDRQFVGADDAASAVGLILTLAADLAKAPDQAKQLELAFFDGEEAFGENLTPRDGLFGSRRYAADWRKQESRPEFGILLDMVGHRNLSIKIPSDSPEKLATLLFEVVEEQKQDQHFGRAATPILDDHVPLNDIGIPTIDIIGDFVGSNWWHNSRDNLDLISPKSLEISYGVVRAMLDKLLSPSS